MTQRSLVPQLHLDYHLHCGIPSLSNEIEQSLSRDGWSISNTASIELIIDGPWGYGLQFLTKIDCSNVVIVTDNPCPEYWEDLWGHRPRALLAGGHSIHSIAESLRRALKGEFFRHTPQHECLLTTTERALLRYCALGWDTERIATQQKCAEGTVRNGLSRVFQKLGFDNRTQATLYYWGLWHLLIE